MDPLLLDYARFHGIASDYASIDPLSYIDGTFTTRLEDDSTSQSIQSECNDRLHIARVTVKEKLRDKLRVSKENFRFLTSLIHDARAEGLVINWDDILPDFHRVDDAKVEPPIFCLEHESDVRLSKYPLRYLTRDIDLQLPEATHEMIGVHDPFVSLRVNGSPLTDQVKKDRLRCSKESFSLIQSVRNDDGRSMEELEGVLGSLLEQRRSGSIELESPILPPLTTDCLSSSPTPIPDEHMLPSPVSSASIELDLHCRHTTPWMPTSEDFVCDSAKDRPDSYSPIRENLRDRAVPIERDIPGHNVSDPDTDRCIEASSSSTGLQTKGKDSIIDTTAAQTRDPVDNISNSLDESDTCNNSYTKKADNEISTTKTARLPFSEDAELASEHSTIIECQRQRSDVNPRNESFKATSQSSCTKNSVSLSQTLTGHAATAMAKRPAQKSRTGLCQEHKPEYLHGVHDTEREAESVQESPGPQSPRTSLGSLASFLETRGKRPKRQIPAKSPYFENKVTQDSGRNNSVTSPYAQENLRKRNMSAPKSMHMPPIPAVQIPRVPTRHEGLVLFISTALLKTHLRVIQCLEGSEHPPKLIYRDYAVSSSNCQSRPQLKLPTPQHQQMSTPPDEADIILSPKTGIILTTSQATIQLYLPGHTPSSTQPNITKIKAINSPLRESIFRLASRYQQLYVFILLGPRQSKQPKSGDSNPQPSANKHLISSITSLNAFCASLSEYASITPLLVPSVPESVAAWILALAHKHICQLPPLRSQFQYPYSITFTPVNPKPQLGGLLENPGESVWELFLRRMGLNPYAAQVVLAVLKGENGDVVNIPRYNESSLQGGGGGGCLSRFVEMASEERRVLFGGILGEMILKRVASLIERDWQCDWALNFDDGIE
ncbi:hypothetical protein BDW62DRAFT_219547 [Aspergillus aurantiobrunneus]